jgi:hypothetical protein
VAGLFHGGKNGNVVGTMCVIAAIAVENKEKQLEHKR